MSEEIPEVLKKVLSLEGTWEADATLKMGKDTFNFKYKLDFKKLPSGQGLLLDESGDIQGVGPLLGTTLIGFDPHGGKLHWFSVDNFGTTHDHIGELVADNHLRLKHESQKEGKEFKEVIDFVWNSENEMETKLIAMLGEEAEEELTGTFIKI